jgi:hypothetical protein
MIENGPRLEMTNDKKLYENKKYTSTYLSQHVTKGPAHKRCHGLGGKGVLIERIIVLGPAGNSSSANLNGVAEEGASDRAILAESRLGSSNTLLDRAAGGGDTEGARGKEGDEKESKELHSERGSGRYKSERWKQQVSRRVSRRCQL